MRLLVLTVATAAAFASSATAQTAQFKCATPGTTVEFSNGSKTTWIAQEGNYCRQERVRGSGAHSNGKWFAPGGYLPSTAGQAWIDQVKPWTLWPLTVGKKLSTRYEGIGADPTFVGKWTINFTVEKFEKVTVKAGSFDTLVVVYETDGINHRYKLISREWYAPDAGIVVKFEFIDGPNRFTGDAVAIRP